MNVKYPENWPDFFTATIFQWNHLLRNDQYKDIIIDSLRFGVRQRRIKLYAFVIMSNHIHIIWQQLPPYTRTQVQHGFMKYTAQQIKYHLQQHNPDLLKEFKVDLKDREYQIWKRRPLSVELFTEKVFEQKLEYIHNNPVKAAICKWPEEYKYSSARYYYDDTDLFGLFTGSTSKA